MEVLSTFLWGDLRIIYYRHGAVVGWQLLPESVEPPTPDESWLEPLIQVSLRGDAASGGFAAGHTLRGGATLEGLCFREQLVDSTSTGQSVTTVFDAGPTEFSHLAAYQSGHRGFRVHTEVVHRGEPVVLEMLSSFALGGVSPLPGGTKPSCLTIHRLRSTWSNEGRVVSERAEDLQLEPSWSHHGVRVERFGQVGSLPVRKFFPFVAVEDTTNSVVWAAQVACASSWQIELVRRGEALGISGGLADFELGHWAKTMRRGDRLETPWAFLTVALGSLDSVSQRLLDLYPQDACADSEQRIPVVFNEFCSSWGQPSEQRISRQLEALKGRGLDFFVIDAGWYADPESGWERGHGDWRVGAPLFPRGLGAVATAIRKAGLRPGLWFELETCGPLSQAYQKDDHLLHRHGVTITSGQRRFWDMADPWVVEYLSESVIQRLRDDGFDYLKIDYNESLGVGCDGAESLGEGLRQKILATQEFFRKIRRELPNLVVESCASGGHRLEASMVGLTDFSSFSDAHECPEVPALAANLHRVIPPRQSQIWAVLRANDSPQRLAYSLAATFLGVPCLSGEVEDLTPTQWQLAEAALGFHRRIAPILCDGTTLYHGPRQASYRDLRGWQGILRVSRSSAKALVVIHTFAGVIPSVLEIPLPWPGRVVGTFGWQPNTATVVGQSLRVEGLGDQEAAAFLVEGL